MNVSAQSLPLPNPSPRQVQGQTPLVLSEALQDDVNLAVWQRRLPLHVSSFAHTLLSLGEPLGESRVVEVHDDQPLQLPELAWRFADLEGYAGFVADVAWLTQAYACLLGAQRVGLRLRVLDSAMCPRFHVDWVSLRLITTYAGAGSEWLPEVAFPRERLGEAGVEPDQPPRQLAEGDVALFKGERWEGNAGRGIVHRSPSAGPRQRRLIMTLDWL
ncbi:DUF1826 domain-containing protein [Pseudomonas sp. nanlin1]|uniref:DUF1826 domain-containing protein n=1 Tax=Pseudomonas sp. nanlin1 TaxID=3040605 RepID=UPI00388D4ABC